MKAEEIARKIDTYVAVLQQTLSKLDDNDGAIAVLKEIGKDLRTEQLQNAWKSGMAAKHSGGYKIAGKYQKASDKQIAYLKDLGVDVTENLSRKKASELIENNTEKN